MAFFCKGKRFCNYASPSSGARRVGEWRCEPHQHQNERLLRSLLFGGHGLEAPAASWLYQQGRQIDDRVQADLNVTSTPT